MSSHIGKRFLISGRVQGVFYRRFACKAAENCHLTGWTRNLPDGRVEVEAFGEASHFETFAAQLQKGPPAARVLDITAETIAWEEHTEFKVLEG